MGGDLFFCSGVRDVGRNVSTGVAGRIQGLHSFLLLLLVETDGVDEECGVDMCIFDTVRL